MLTFSDTAAHQPTDAEPDEDEWEPYEGRGREPLPAGHPLSWGAITAGTLLDGVPYPLPVFER